MKHKFLCSLVQNIRERGFWFASVTLIRLDMFVIITVISDCNYCLVISSRLGTSNQRFTRLCSPSCGFCRPQKNNPKILITSFLYHKLLSKRDHGTMVRSIYRTLSLIRKEEDRSTSRKDISNSMLVPSVFVLLEYLVLYF